MLNFQLVKCQQKTCPGAILAHHITTAQSITNTSYKHPNQSYAFYISKARYGC